MASLKTETGKLKPIVIAVDPGYDRVGIAVMEGTALIFSECFIPPKGAVPIRLGAVFQHLGKIIKKYKPEVLAIETLFLNTNQKTVMRVAEARGIVVYEASKTGLKVFEASPPQIKMATTGYGRANKEQIMKMVRILVEIEKNKASDDEMDAIAIALTAFAHNRGSIKT